ncbi:hypothetical protein Tco_1027707 [Tanacetum coccineum]
MSTQVSKEVHTNGVFYLDNPLKYINGLLIHLKISRKKDARNMTLEELVIWAKEEANSPCFHTPQRHLGEVSKMIIDDNEDEHVAQNIVDKGVDYDVSAMEVVNDNILVSNDNVGAIEVVDDNILVSNKNVGAKEEVDGNILVCNDNVSAKEEVSDNLVGLNLIVSPTNEEYVDIIGILGAQNLDVSMDSVLGFEDYLVDVNVAKHMVGECAFDDEIIEDVDMEVYNFPMDDNVNHNADNGDNADNVDNGVVLELKACVGRIQSESLGVNVADYTTTNAHTQVAFEGNLSNVTPSRNGETVQLIPTRKSQRINNQKKEPKLACVGST